MNTLKFKQENEKFCKLFHNSETFPFKEVCSFYENGGVLTQEQVETMLKHNKSAEKADYWKMFEHVGAVEWNSDFFRLLSDLIGARVYSLYYNTQNLTGYEINRITVADVRKLLSLKEWKTAFLCYDAIELANMLVAKHNRAELIENLAQLTPIINGMITDKNRHTMSRCYGIMTRYVIGGLNGVNLQNREMMLQLLNIVRPYVAESGSRGKVWSYIEDIIATNLKN